MDNKNMACEVFICIIYNTSSNFKGPNHTHSADGHDKLIDFAKDTFSLAVKDTFSLAVYILAGCLQCSHSVSQSLDFKFKSSFDREMVYGAFV